jgi:hypothetical protein
MRHKMFLAMICFMVLFSLLTPTTTLAQNYYAWFQRGNFFGIWAYISTPSTPPSMPFTLDSTGNYYTLQSHSLTTPGGNSWAQVGILYYPGGDPQQYYEYADTLGGYDLVLIGTQEWGKSVKYEVSHNGAQTWCVWVGGDQIQCLPNTDTAPNIMSAQSEVHYDPNTRIQTQFTDIKVRNSSGVWVDPSISSYMHKNYPYDYTVTSSSSFSTWRKTTTDRFIPLITECDNCYGNP